MPRLLILCEYPTVLGGERSMLATLPAVRAAGFEVLIAAPPTGPLACAICEAQVELCPWQTRDATGIRPPLGDLRANLQRLIGRVRPEIVHANSLSISRISGPIVYDGAARSIGHLRDIIRLNAQAINDINRHNCIVTVSAATRDFHISQGLDSTKSRVLYNGVDLTLFQGASPNRCLHQELGVPADVRFIASIGQLGLRKAVDVALRAAEMVAHRLHDVHWLVVGERTSNKPESLEYERALREVTARPPLLGRMHFLGQRQDIAQLLPQCTALVHAARQEPLGRILLEAAASGLPVIATDVGGTAEIFPQECKAAILVPPDNAEAIAAATVRVLSDECLRRQLGTNARRRVEIAFNIRTTCQPLLNAYQELLA